MVAAPVQPERAAPLGTPTANRRSSSDVARQIRGPDEGDMTGHRTVGTGRRRARRARARRRPARPSRLALSLLAAAPAAAAAPANDARTAPQALALPTTVQGTTVEATLEPDEPPSACGRALKGSVWYAFTVDDLALGAPGRRRRRRHGRRRRRLPAPALPAHVGRPAGSPTSRGEATVDIDVAEDAAYLVRVAPLSELGGRPLLAARRRARPAGRTRPGRCSRPGAWPAPSTGSPTRTTPGRSGCSGAGRTG